MSYCKPGRADTVYCGKGEKVYRSKHYLLWTIKEALELYNSEHSTKVSYHAVQQVIQDEKHLFKIGETTEDDCRCEKCQKCENADY